MSAKTIETRAIFSAQDRSGNTFAFIAKKVMGVEEAAKHAQSRIEAFNKSTSRSSVFAKRAEIAAEATSRASGMHHMVATAAAAMASGVAAHHVIVEGAKRLHERVRMEASGMAESEIAEATQLAAKLSRDFKPVNQTETMHMIRNARAIVGSYQEAAEIMEPLMKLRVIAQANRPGQDVSEDFDQLVKGLEIKGVTQHPEQFKNYMEGIARGLNVFGDTLKPYQYYEMFKYGRQATPSLSSDFILGTAPTLAQELGGSSYGNAVSGFNRSVVGGRMEHSALKEMYRIGLADKGDLDFVKTGEVKGMKAGHHLKGYQLAQSDPNEWVKQYLIPAFEKMGITTAEAMMTEISTLFSNKVAAQMVGMLATQQSRIDKDRALLAHAPGLSAAERYMKEDFSIAFQGFKNQLENAAAAMGAPLAKVLTPAVTAAAEALAIYSQRIQFNTEALSNHPGEASPAQRHFNRLMNIAVLDIDDEHSAFGIPKDKFRDRDLRDRRQSLRQLIGAPGEEEEARKRAIEEEAYYKSHPVLGALGMIQDRAPHSRYRADEIVRSRQQLDDLDRATFKRMVTENELDNVHKTLKAAREPFYRLDRRGSTSVPGSLAMPMSLGYGGVDPLIMNTGNHRPPVVAMPTGGGGAPAVKPPPAQPLKVGFEPAKVEVLFRVEAGSSLLAVVNDTKKATASIRAFATHPDTGPGSLGETVTGQ